MCANLAFCHAFVYYLFTSPILLIHKFYFCHFFIRFLTLSCAYLSEHLAQPDNQLYALVDFIPHMSQSTSSKAVAGQHSCKFSPLPISRLFSSLSRLFLGSTALYFSPLPIFRLFFSLPRLFLGSTARKFSPLPNRVFRIIFHAFF